MRYIYIRNIHSNYLVNELNENIDFNQ